MKDALFCLGTHEELSELKDSIRDLVRAGNTVYILYDFDPVQPLDHLGARVYQDELPPVAPFKDLTLDLLVTGHQSKSGKDLVTNGEKRPWVLYQGQQSDASDWLDLHESIYMVWGETKDHMKDWDDMEHDPWIAGGWKGSFSNTCLAMLSDF